ncbi:general transcription factor 3C polypeptide 4-like [Conger conger]|uniref:general transcription factor 3C polypeptide 4-like n=1 Tax=Conger conger TaxID=82655 RepID=UPI002A5AA7EA|nr:general transcription factor 3C polypeptide 4-like [Conger conger]
MAASSTDHAADRGEAEPEPDTSVLAGHAPIVKREPEVKLLSPASGMEPLSWSEDHRISASCTNSVSLMEIVCDIHSYSRDMVIHRTSIPVPEDVCVLQVGPEQEVLEAKEKLASSRDPAVSQVFKLDRSMNPTTGTLPPMRGTKYTCWSPLGCDATGRCLLACLTLDSRLAVYGSTHRQSWELLVDLTQLYGQMLAEKGYSFPGAEPPAGRLDDPAELQRRHRMQAPVRMEWSSVCSTQQVQTNNECKDVGTVLLAVLMENGDLAVWHFSLPFLGGGSVVSCSALRSGVAQPSALAWWEYEHGGRKMSGLIVGSLAGPVKILPVNLKAVKGYFTLRQPVVLWQEADQIPVHNIKCVSLFHPQQKCSCSLVVAARGPYLFWCLLLISKAGLNVHNSHVTGLHSAPIVSMAAGRHGGAVYTYASDGALKRLTPVFTDLAVTFRQDTLELPERVAGMRIHGLALSPNGAYLALLTAEGTRNWQHPVNQNFRVQFVALKTADGAAAELMESRVQSLYRQADLLDLVRWRVVQDKRIPPGLQDELDEKVHQSGCAYLWRFKLFLCRVLYASLQKAPAQARWRPAAENAAGEEAEEGGGGADGGGAGEEGGGPSESAEAQGQEGEVSEEQVGEITAWIEAMETHLTREHMKSVLGEVYLHTWITENTSIPTRGVCDFLTSDTTYEDRAAKVLIGHIFKKMNKQTFPEYCSLCKEVLPFTDRKQAVCSNGHIWLRCVLTYQACQSLNYRRCLLLDSIARHPVPEDPDWIKRILQGPCTFCDSPLF